MVIQPPNYAEDSESKMKAGELAWIAIVSLACGALCALVVLYCCKYFKRRKAPRVSPAGMGSKSDDTLEFLPSLPGCSCKRQQLKVRDISQVKYLL